METDIQTDRNFVEGIFFHNCFFETCTAKIWSDSEQCTDKTLIYIVGMSRFIDYSRGEPRLELSVHRLWNYFGIHAPSSIVFYLEMEVEVELGVHHIRSRFTPRDYLMNAIYFIFF